MRKEFDFSKGKRGAIVPKDPRKTRITIRIDTKILNWFRERVHEAGGGNYQTMINEALKEFIGRRSINVRMGLTDLVEPTTTVSGSVTLSTGRVSSAWKEGLLVQHGYLMDKRSAYVAPKKDEDERKKYALAA
jgi:hypothetical protein